jgi:Ca-activated chloride channel family protein
MIDPTLRNAALISFTSAIATIVLYGCMSTDRASAPMEDSAPTSEYEQGSESPEVKASPSMARMSKPAAEEPLLSVSRFALAASVHSESRPEYEYSTEQYDLIEEDGYIRVDRDPLSTFSIDVDTASYANVRRMLRDGILPPKGAVRIEELVNYFSYDYPDLPEGADAPFSIVTDAMPAPWNVDHTLVMIALQGMRIDTSALPPRNLTFLLDVSGSMASPDRLPLVVWGLSTLVKELRPEDHVAIVVYAGASGLVLPPTSGADQATILDALARLTAGGSTNGADGIQLAYRAARANFDPRGINRVILATDGDFNVGMSDRSSLVELIERERESGVFLTVLGVGRGNLKDATMEQLADHGNGNYAYLDSADEAYKVLVEESGSTLVTIAKDVKIQVEFNPHHVAAYRLIGYENRRLENQDFNDDRRDAGEIGAGHSVTALYELIPAGQAVPGHDVDPLRYQEADEPRLEGLHASELLTVKLRYKRPDGDNSMLLTRSVEADDHLSSQGSEDLRFASAVTMFGLLLRDSPFRGDASFEAASELARGAIGRDEHGDRDEFLELVARASDLNTAEPRDTSLGMRR